MLRCVSEKCKTGGGSRLGVIFVVARLFYTFLTFTAAIDYLYRLSFLDLFHDWRHISVLPITINVPYFIFHTSCSILHLTLKANLTFSLLAFWRVSFWG